MVPQLPRHKCGLGQLPGSDPRDSEIKVHESCAEEGAHDVQVRSEGSNIDGKGERLNLVQESAAQYPAVALKVRVLQQWEIVRDVWVWARRSGCCSRLGKTARTIDSCTKSHPLGSLPGHPGLLIYWSALTSYMIARSDLSLVHY